MPDRFFFRNGIKIGRLWLIIEFEKLPLIPGYALKRRQNAVLAGHYANLAIFDNIHEIVVPKFGKYA